MTRSAPTNSWFEIPEARPALSGTWLTMRGAWLKQVGLVRCERCGRPILAGDRFRLTPYCPMGGRLDLVPEALGAFADALEVHAWHADCDEHAVWRVPVTPPFSLEKTARAFQRLPVNETQVWRDGGLLRCVQLGGQHTAMRIAQPDAETLEITLPEVALSEGERREITERVRWMLGVDRDLQPFAQRAERFPRLRALFDDLTGLKPPRFPHLFEALVNTLLFQQISLHAGTALLNRLARGFGETYSTVRGEVQRLPTAEEVSAIPEEALGEIGFSRHKARSLVALARSIAAGEIEFEALDGLPTPALEQRLVALPGIGPWSARVIMLRGFGRLDTFPTGDSGAAKTLRALFEVSDADGQRLQDELLEALAPYQGFLYFCLLGWRLMRAGVLK